MSLATRIKAVIFDMDGVLIDAREWHYEALNRALEIYGHTIGRDEHLTTFNGLSTLTKLNMLSRQRGLPFEVHRRISEIKQSYTMDMFRIQCRPDSVHQRALSRLKQRGYKLALASNSIRQTVDIMVYNSDLRQYLDVTLSNEDVENPKPNPEVYNRAFRLLGLLPDECLVLEDNGHGIEAATAAGAHLMIIRDVNEVNYENICKRISEVEKRPEQHRVPDLVT